MRCQNPTCDKSEGLGYRMIQTELGYICSTCYGIRKPLERLYDLGLAPFDGYYEELLRREK